MLTIEAVLRECEEYFDERADADLSTGVPSEEMKLLLSVRMALRVAADKELRSEVRP